MTRKADKSTIHSKYLQDYCQPLKPETRAVIVHLDKLIKSWQPDLPVTIWHSMGYPIIGYGKAAYQGRRPRTRMVYRRPGGSQILFQPLRLGHLAGTLPA